MLPLVFLYCGVNLVIAADSFSKETDSNNKGVIVADSIARNYSIATYFDRDENSIRVPEIKFEDKKKLKTKKSPKRTIQKIIKRQRKQKKRLMSEVITSEPTKATEQIREEPNFQEEDEPTTIPSRPNRQRRRPEKKWRNTHTTLYPRKASRKQRNVNIRAYERKSNKKNSIKLKKRQKRELGRDLFILKNLDETELYNNKNPNEVLIKAHVKKYWEDYPLYKTLINSK